MGRRFSAIDCDQPARVTQDALVFGETSPLTIVTLLNLAESLEPQTEKHFVDLGCGRGLSCLVAACIGWKASGLEFENSWLVAARQVAEDLDLAVDFLEGDFLARDWPSRGVFYVVGTAFENTLLSQILKRIPTGSHLIACDWAIDSPHWDLAWEGPLPVDWGQAYLRVYRGPLVETLTGSP